MYFSSLFLDISFFFGLYFQLFLLVTFFEMREKGTEKKTGKKVDGMDSKGVTTKSADFPKVSITIPCLNEAKTVEKTLLSLLALDYPKEKLSFLVVDDGSTDNTYDIASRFVEKIKAEALERATAQTATETALPSIQVIRQQNGGKYTAINRGITTSDAEFIGCLDADSSVDPQALRLMIPYFSDPKVMAVTPAMRVSDAKNILQYIQRVEYNIGIFTKRIMAYINGIHVTPGPFSIFRKSVFKEIGLFRHAHNTEDMEIAFRIQSFGYRIANCHTAFVYTITPPTWKKLYRQRTRWSYGFIKNCIDYRFIFLKKKYGNLGMLTLPFAVVGMFLSFGVIGLFIYHFGHTTYMRINQAMIVGIHFRPSFGFSFDWFFVNTSLDAFLALILISSTILIMFLGKKMAENTARPSLDMVYFALFYGFMAPIWLGKAIYNAALSKKTPWR